ncbi:MAG TPA: hypothetical protein VGO40_04010 [Longimicrobium sp.]|nr:hypothetical protein [Longimicrobium sp.]
MQPSHPSFESADGFASPAVSVDRPEPGKTSTAVRVLAVVGGIVALLAGSILSLGMGLVALLGFGATALLWRARHARLTRRASWIGAVLAVGISFGGLVGWGMSQVPGGAVESMQQSMDQASREPPPPIVRQMQRLWPPNPRAQKRVDSITRSKPFLWWTMVTTFVIGSVLMGLMIGTPAWGCAMLIGYGLRGHWPMPPPVPRR